MSQPVPRQPRAAGAFIALSVIVGTVIGAMIRQPSAGILAGAAVGVAIALILWLVDRRA